jgi:hypothetical protein
MDLRNFLRDTGAGHFSNGEVRFSAAALFPGRRSLDVLPRPPVSLRKAFGALFL